MSTEAQQRTALARRLLLAVAAPVALLVLLGLVLGRHILQMTEDARWVDHADEVLGQANDTLRQVIDQETGIRGFLITKDHVFLESFERARPDLGFARLHDLVADNPAQQARFDDVRRRYEGWVASANEVTRGRDVDRARLPVEMLERKVRMDGIREGMQQAVAVEIGLRRTRAATAAASTESMKLLLLGLLLGAALVLAILSRTQLTAIAGSFGAALEAERKAREATEVEAWIRAGHAKLADAVQGERGVEQLGKDALAILAAYVGADVGALFTREAGEWRRRAGYSLDTRAAGPDRFGPGEGLVGRAAMSPKLLHMRQVPPEFLQIRSGTGQASPSEVVLIPACVDGDANAVLELGFLRQAGEATLELLGRIAETLALAVRSAEYKQQLRRLLEESHRQAEELQTQQEELRVANEELEVQTTALRSTQKQLETQQAELEQTNDHLVVQTRLLENRNQDLAASQSEIAAKVREVERASQFKSEFLSNMSHELRTPLNSSLILAKLLADNRDGNLTPEQIKFAETIYASGNDLLALINDILDLAKIESGKMEVRVAKLPLTRIRDVMTRTFEPIANEKGLRFSVTLSGLDSVVLETDGQRLEQILKNLISNALKFTDRGEVGVDVAEGGERMVFLVRDTGIGIPTEQQAFIFEAFRQAEAAANRRFGGTGLGLSISRELARLLGGDISVRSQVGQGSAFTLSVPRVYAGPLAAALASGPTPQREPTETVPVRVRPSAAPDDAAGDVSEALGSGKRVVLIVEDDASFAVILADVAREAGFASVVAHTAERGIRLARSLSPVGIVLDLKLPDHPGLSVLDRLKRDPATRHIPVHIVSASDSVEAALSMGAAEFLAKPVNREQLAQTFRSLEARSAHRLRHVLVVEDDEALRTSVAALLARGDVEVSTAASASEALALLARQKFDCVVTDLALPDRSGYELLETMAAEEPYSVPPVIVYTGRALTSEDEQRLRKYSSSIIIKGARSPERLLDEVTLFLHQVESELPVEQRRLLKQARHREAVFEGRTVLVVEDDVRNVFALTSVLEPKGARVAIARTGKDALTALEKEPHIDLVLMDVMMPEMDGIEATREIRKNPRWSRLPIIALTAKAMRDDQERCMAAGANDYLAKPLDVEMLLSLLRVWMPKGR